MMGSSDATPQSHSATPGPRLADVQAAHRAGNLALAEAGYRQWVDLDMTGEAAHGLALILAQTNRLTESIPWYRRATELSPQRPDFWNNLGEAQRRAGDAAAGTASLKRAVQLAPNVAEFHFTYGGTLRDAGDLTTAIAAYRRAIELEPRHVRAHYNLGNALRRDGRLPVAIQHYRKAIELKPDWWEPRYNLAVTHLQLGESAEALQLTEGLTVPAHATVDREKLLADIAERQGRTAAVRSYYSGVAARQPGNRLLSLRLATMTSVIPESEAAIDADRARAAAEIERLQQESPVWTAAELKEWASEPPLMWGYHGRDDRALKAAYAQLFLNSIAPVELPQRPQTDRPHVGFVVTPGHEGVFDRCLGPLVDRLARRGRLRVSWVSTHAGLNVLRHLRPTFAGDTLPMPDEPSAAAAAIAVSRIDHLYFWEVGTDALNYFLPFYRPAAWQWAGWGWPVTTGNPRISGFVSSAWLEPADSDSHYSERLIRLPQLPTCYERPPVPDAVPERSQFGFRGDEPLVLCAQNLRKLQPVFDDWLYELLDTHAQARLVLLADEQATVTEQFRARLQSVAKPVMDRVSIVPRMPREEYLQLTRLADVILDPIGYGGGANTALDAAAAATPVVTCPGPFHRGRWQAAVNTQLELPGLNVASRQDWLRVTLRLLNDKDERLTLRQQIRARSAALFENTASITDLEEFFLSASASAPTSGE
jgi:protein O-GlcNAc transferase